MKVVILAAGLGTRLRPWTQETPKGLLKLAGRPILYRTMRVLQDLGVDEFIIVTNEQYLPAYRAFVQRYGFPCRFIVNPHPERGNGYSLYLAREALCGQSFVLVMGDHVYEPAFLEQAIQGRGLIVDRRGDFIDPREAQKVQWRDGRTVAIGRDIPGEGFDTGFFVLDTGVFLILERLITQRDVVEMRDVVQAAQLPVTEVSGYFWSDIDTPADLRRARKVIIRMAVKGVEDGWIARTLNRRISTLVSQTLVERVSPLQATVLAFLCGILAAVVAFFNPVWGGVLYQFSSILDGVDGEIARASMRTSAFGGWLDSILDRYVDGLFLLALGLSLHPSHGVWVLIVVAVIGSVMVSYTTERYKAAYHRSIYRDYPVIQYFIGKRDERVFLTMIFCILEWFVEMFVTLAVLTHLRVWLTVFCARRGPSQGTTVA